MTTATAAKTADHYVVREIETNGECVACSHEMDTLQDALEMRDLALGATGNANLVVCVVFTDGTEQVIA
jgi:hypothetical protein